MSKFNLPDKKLSLHDLSIQKTKAKIFNKIMEAFEVIAHKIKRKNPDITLNQLIAEAMTEAAKEVKGKIKKDENKRTNK